MRKTIVSLRVTPATLAELTKRASLERTSRGLLMERLIEEAMRGLETTPHTPPNRQEGPHAVQGQRDALADVQSTFRAVQGGGI